MNRDSSNDFIYIGGMDLGHKSVFIFHIFKFHLASSVQHIRGIIKGKFEHTIWC